MKTKRFFYNGNTGAFLGEADNKKEALEILDNFADVNDFEIYDTDNPGMGESWRVDRYYFDNNLEIIKYIY